VTVSCEWIRGRAAELVAGRCELSDDVRLHLEACSSCRAITEGAGVLRADLDAWSAPEPPDDLLERTMARLALAGAAAPPSAPPEPVPAPLTLHRGGRRRRTSVELLTATHLRADHQAPTRGRLVVRLLVQAAAAAVLFGVCTTFVAVFYPAVTYALEERRVQRCQDQLTRLGQAARRYHDEHPEAAALHGAELRRALIRGGYADPHDFVCPGHAGKELGERAYVGSLPPGSEPLPLDRPVIYDRFANHSSGFNVAYGSGRVETITIDAFATWRRGEAPGGPLSPPLRAAPPPAANGG
jgi:hypothetical protein